jgi:hypothetical protein
MERESDRKNHSLIRYLAAFVFGALVTLAVVSARGIFQETDVARIYRLLCDGLFLSAALLIGVGLLTLVSGEGLFDIVGFAMICLVSVIRIKDGEEKRRTFLDYKKARSEKRHGTMWYLVFVGLLYLAAAFAFDMLFNAMA